MSGAGKQLSVWHGLGRFWCTAVASTIFFTQLYAPRQIFMPAEGIKARWLPPRRLHGSKGLTNTTKEKDERNSGRTTGIARALMAHVTDVDPDLQPLARRIPIEIRALMTVFEIQQRSEYSAQLLADADSCSDDRQAEQLRKKAGRILKAMAADSYSQETKRLHAELATARLRGDDQQSLNALSELRRLETQHPQTPADRMFAAALVAAGEFTRDKLSIPPVTRSRLFSRSPKPRK